MPNEQNPFQRRLNIAVLANVVILGADSLDIALNGPMHLFLLLIELRQLPIILDEFAIFLTFSL